MSFQKYKILPNKLKMPQIAYGCYKQNGGGVTASIKEGFRHIDCAKSYGNEEVVGMAINYCIDLGIVKREDLFITSKIAYPWFGYQSTIDCVNDSLKEMNIDYFDLYLIHDADPLNENWKHSVIDTYRALETLYKEGKIKAIGVSNFQIEHLEYLLPQAEIKPMINQIEVHPEHQQREVVKYCKSHGIEIACWGALNQGRIFNNQTILDIAKKYSKTPAQIAIKWSIQHDFTPLATSSKPDRIKQMLEIDDFEITNDDMNVLDLLDGGEWSHWFCEKPVKYIKESDLMDFAAKIAPKNIETTDNYKKYYKIFGFIPFLKEVKKTDTKIKWYLFGCPILKITKKKI